MAKMAWKTDDEINQEKQMAEFKQQVSKQESERQRVITDFMVAQAEEYILDADIPDEDKKRFAGIFEPFDVGISYEAGRKVNYDGVVYEVIQAHTSQLDWLPADVPALFKVFLQPATDEGTDIIHPWVQPIGAHDAYPVDAKVTHKGQIWQSSVTNNIWEPGVYGWELLGDG